MYRSLTTFLRIVTALVVTYFVTNLHGKFHSTVRISQVKLIAVMVVPAAHNSEEKE